MNPKTEVLGASGKQTSSALVKPMNFLASFAHGAAYGVAQHPLKSVAVGLMTLFLCVYIHLICRPRIGISRDATTDVKERQYEIARRGTQITTLKTGFLSTCIAVYGWNLAKGVGFIWHLDLHPFGLKRVVQHLQVASGDDLDGFDLYMTSGFGFIFRVIAFVILESIVFGFKYNYAGPVVWISRAILGGSIFFIVLFNWLKISCDIKRFFGKSAHLPHVRLHDRKAHLMDLLRSLRSASFQKAAIMLIPRVEITVDADEGPSGPFFELGDAVLSSKSRFEPTSDSSPFKLPSRVGGD